MNNIDSNTGEIVMYQPDETIRLEVRVENETVWLTQQQIADLFQSSRTNVVEHVMHIYEDEELEESSTCRKFRQVRKEGKRMVSRVVPMYNLDMIISLTIRSLPACEGRVFFLCPLRHSLPLIPYSVVNHQPCRNNSDKASINLTNQ